MTMLPSPNSFSPRPPAVDDPAVGRFDLAPKADMRCDDTPSSGKASSFRSRAQALLSGDDGYSLTELMIVLVVIGILALIALPKFMSVATKAKMTEAKTQLKHLHTLQKAHYYERDIYAGELDMLGFEQAPLVTDGGTARYEIEIEDSGRSSYVAQATAVIDYDNDGTFNVWEVDHTGNITQTVAD